MDKTIVGIDIGHKGAFSILYPDGIIIMHDMPISKKEGKTVYDLCGISKIFNLIKDENAVIYVEKAIILPHGFNIKTTASLFYCEGVLSTFATIYNIPYHQIHPKTWMTNFGISRKKGDTKEQSMEIAKKTYPQVTMETKRGRKLDGRADALLIAKYGQQTLNERIF